MNVPPLLSDRDAHRAGMDRGLRHSLAAKVHAFDVKLDRFAGSCRSKARGVFAVAMQPGRFGT